MIEQLFRTWTFGSYVKVMASIGFSIGCVVGTLSFAITLVNGSVRVNGVMVVDYLSKVAIGAVLMVLVPVILTISGAVLALISFVPFRLLMRAQRGIIVRGE